MAVIIRQRARQHEINKGATRVDACESPRAESVLRQLFQNSLLLHVARDASLDPQARLQFEARNEARTNRASPLNLVVGAPKGISLKKL